MGRNDWQLCSVICLSILSVWLLEASDNQSTQSWYYDDYEYEAMQQDAMENAYYQNSQITFYSSEAATTCLGCFRTAITFPCAK